MRRLCGGRRRRRRRAAGALRPATGLWLSRPVQRLPVVTLIVLLVAGRCRLRAVAGPRGGLRRLAARLVTRASALAGLLLALTVHLRRSLILGRPALPLLTVAVGIALTGLLRAAALTALILRATALLTLILRPALVLLLLVLLLLVLLQRRQAPRHKIAVEPRVAVLRLQRERAVIGGQGGLPRGDGCRAIVPLGQRRLPQAIARVAQVVVGVLLQAQVGGARGLLEAPLRRREDLLPVGGGPVDVRRRGGASQASGVRARRQPQQQRHHHGR